MEWKITNIGSLCDRVCSGGTPKSTNNAYYNGNIPWLNTKEVNFNRIYDTEKNITQLGLENSSAKWISENSVIVAMYGATAGKVAITKIPITTNQACCNLSINSEIADYNFVYYFLCSKFYELSSLANGGAQQNLNAQIIKDFPIKIPVNLSDQRKIAGTLSALDAKIENNNKINANLEAQAEALFKSWFVDFTPFKDQPFVDSELGPIPQGWKVGKYEDIILDTLAGDWGKEKITGNYTHEVACVRGCDFQDMNNGYRGNTPQRYILEKNYSAKRLLPQDLIIEISGGTLTVSTGRACLVSKEMLEKYDNNLVCTNFCKVIRPIDGYSAYCYYSWLHKYNNRVMFGYENGSSGLKNFRFKDFLTKEPLLIPPKADLIKFQHIIKLLQQKKQTNGTESTKLAALRDTLLPKLMSGEIKL